VAVERIRVAAHWRKLLVGADAEERAVQLARQLALDLEIEELALEAERLVDRHEGRAFRKRRRHGSMLSSAMRRSIGAGIVACRGAPRTSAAGPHGDVCAA